MAEKKSWQSGLWPLISFVDNKTEGDKGVQSVVDEMIVVHNVAIRHITAIYLQSENVAKLGTAKDVTEFLEYCAIWVSFLNAHHGEEEERFFPDIENLAGVPGLMTGNIEQHAAFHDGVIAFGEYVDSAKSGKEKYDGLKFKKHIEAFMPALYNHLQEEISTLKGLEKFKNVDWKTFLKETSARIIKKAQDDPVAAPILMPFMLSGQDNTFENSIRSWPPMPWVAKQLFKWWFIPKHKEWWRFAPCNSSSQPRELPFASAA